jgi:hypothetical protein
MCCALVDINGGIHHCGVAYSGVTLFLRANPRIGIKSTFGGDILVIADIELFCKLGSTLSFRGLLIA